MESVKQNCIPTKSCCFLALNTRPFLSSLLTPVPRGIPTLISPLLFHCLALKTQAGKIVFPFRGASESARVLRARPRGQFLGDALSIQPSFRVTNIYSQVPLYTSI